MKQVFSFALAALLVSLLTSCLPPALPRELISHEVTIPSTNHYKVGGLRRIYTDLDKRGRRTDSIEHPWRVRLEFSRDGTSYRDFPRVVYSVGANTMGIREIAISNADIWVRATTTNAVDVGKSFQLIIQRGGRFMIANETGIIGSRNK